MKNVINVPKDMCPMDVLAAIKGTENAWIFLSKSAVDRMKATADSVEEYCSLTIIKWEADQTHPATEIILLEHTNSWKRVFKVNASDIAFKNECEDPEKLFFLKMVEE